ncbi:hypothetical protein DFH29DRAFT_411834 [Suillus ampliporus]|nr:hypothetical protein DFH29DRAFT_411834 [Suillus ampliporus]
MRSVLVLQVVLALWRGSVSSPDSEIGVSRLQARFKEQEPVGFDAPRSYADFSRSELSTDGCCSTKGCTDSGPAATIFIRFDILLRRRFPCYKHPKSRMPYITRKV